MAICAVCLHGREPSLKQSPTAAAAACTNRAARHPAHRWTAAAGQEAAGIWRRCAPAASQDAVTCGQLPSAVGDGGPGWPWLRAGYWNGFGGKVEAGETVEAAARRELQEEAGITATAMHHCGRLTFVFDDRPQPWAVHGE